LKIWNKIERKWLFDFMVNQDGEIIVECEQKMETDAEFKKVLRNNYIIVQYTGLLDKHGVKIFEGDILSYRGDYMVNSYKGEVIFKGGAFIDNYWEEKISDLKNVEVIGNIYENKDLLEAR
jgi:uncharacterized phage protein (TIGR01671 family)